MPFRAHHWCSLHQVTWVPLLLWYTCTRGSLHSLQRNTTSHTARHCIGLGPGQVFLSAIMCLCRARSAIHSPAGPALTGDPTPGLNRRTIIISLSIYHFIFSSFFGLFIFTANSDLLQNSDIMEYRCTPYVGWLGGK